MADHQNKSGTLRTHIFCVIAVFLLVIFDQWTKSLAVSTLKDQSAIVIWEGVFELRYLQNSGAAFGIFQNMLMVFFIVTIIICIFLLWLYLRIPFTSHFLALRIPLVVCFAGAIGNFIDRCMNGYVVDFFYFKLIDFPIFNVADCYITCSVIFFVFAAIFVYKDADFDFLESKKKKAGNQKEQESSDT